MCVPVAGAEGFAMREPPRMAVTSSAVRSSMCTCDEVPWRLIDNIAPAVSCAAVMVATCPWLAEMSPVLSVTVAAAGGADDDGDAGELSLPQPVMVMAAPPRRA